jgi:hypothetical protein
MNARSESLLVGDALKELSQLLALARTKRGADRFVVFVPDASDIAEHGLSLVRQTELICAPVIDAVLALYQAALFHLVYDRHQRARVHMENLGEPLLA